MTKAETREVQKTLEHGAVLGLDYVARSLSALHRAARTTKSQREIYEAAYKVRAHLSKEWIV
jgi:hypothetical protein